MTSRIVSMPGVVRPMMFLAWPVLLEQMLNALVGFVDTWLTGHHIPGEAPMAAIGLMSYVMWLLPNLFSAVAIGSTALVSRSIGAGDQEHANRVMHQSLMCGIVLSVVAVAGLWWLDESFIGALNMQGEAASLALTYLRIMIPIVPAIMLVQVGMACLRGAGDTVSGFMAMTCLNIINMIVGIALVTGWGPFPRLGWKGLAMGTASGYVAGAVAILFWLWRGRAGLRIQFQCFAPDVEIVRRLFKVGIPGGVDVAAVLGCHLWFVRIINGLGTLEAAAHMLAVRIEALAYLPGTAFQVAAATMAGQYLGAKDPSRAMRGVTATCWAGVGVMSAAGCLFYFGAEQLTSFFTGSADNPTAVASVPLLRLAAWAMPFLAFTMILSGALRGAGDTRWPLLITLVGFLLVRIPLATFFTSSSLTVPTVGWVIPAGVFGAWCAMVLDLIIRTILSVGRFWHGGWKKTNI